MELRPLQPDERRAAADVVRTSLLTGPLTDEHFDRGIPSSEAGDWVAAWDGDRCVGHTGAFRFDTTVPGGARLATAGYSRVGILPTYTRRGLLTQLMERTLRDAHERGQVLASLRASEAPIYGRFGFGLAGDLVAAIIRRDGARPFRHPTAPGSMRLLARDELEDVVPGIYDRAARRRVGTINRDDWYWTRLLENVNKPTADFNEAGTFLAVHSDPDGHDDGYVHYSVKWAESFAESYRGEGKVLDLWGTDEAVERSLWKYLLDVDLITLWRTAVRPSDDSIRRTFRDHRAYETVQRIDEQWVRILDVDLALRARAYGPAAGAVRIGVHDPFFSDNTGTWTVGPDGAEVTTAEPNVSVDITSLSAVYLGGVSWFDLAASGELANVDADQLSLLDGLFSVRPAPFCGTDF
jgi:predicted acetyltransferase